MNTEDDARLKRRCDFMIKRNPIIPQETFRNETEKIVSTIQNLHFVAKKQFQKLLLNAGNDNSNEEIRRINDLQQPIKNERFITVAIEMAKKCMKSPFQCVEHLHGFESLDSAISHIKLHGPEYIDASVALTVQNSIKRQTEEKCQLLHDETHPDCRNPRCRFSQD